MPVLWAFIHRTNPEETPERLPLEFAPAGTTALRQMRSPGCLHPSQSDAAVSPRDGLIDPVHATVVSAHQIHSNRPLHRAPSRSLLVILALRSVR
jgi:hypothetical protein